MGTIIYRDGTIFVKEIEAEKSASFWRKYGQEKGYKYMYKGYLYIPHGRAQVVVFDKIPWSYAVILKRKDNGFLGIRTYNL